MKIVEQTPDRLRLKSRGIEWVIFACLGGLLVISTGLAGLRLGGGGLGGLVMAIAMIFAGSMMVLFSLVLIEWSIVYTFDRSLGVVRLTRQRVLYTRTVERKLEAICSVQVSKQEDSEPPAHYVIDLVLASGETLQLRGITENPERQEYDQIADRIRRFLALPAASSE